MRADVVNHENVWMVQRTRGLRFLLKTTKAFCVSGKRCWKNLDCYIATDLIIARNIDLSHSAFANLAADLVPTDFFTLWDGGAHASRRSWLFCRADSS